MNKLFYYFASKKLLMAQAKDLSRQLQEAWDARDRLVTRLGYCQDKYHAKLADYNGVLDQLHRVARERDNERRLRLEAEGKLQDYIDELSSLKAAYYSANNKRWDLETANAELLEALKDVLEILGHIPEDDPHETWGNVNASIQEAHDITDDTIRKHKGEGK